MTRGGERRRIVLAPGLPAGSKLPLSDRQLAGRHRCQAQRKPQQTTPLRFAARQPTDLGVPAARQRPPCRRRRARRSRSRSRSRRSTRMYAARPPPHAIPHAITSGQPRAPQHSATRPAAARRTPKLAALAAWSRTTYWYRAAHPAACSAAACPRSAGNRRRHSGGPGAAGRGAAGGGAHYDHSCVRSERPGQHPGLQLRGAGVQASPERCQKSSRYALRPVLQVRGPASMPAAAGPPNDSTVVGAAPCETRWPLHLACG